MNPSSITPSMLAGGAERSSVAGVARRLDQAPNGRVFTVRQVHVDPQVPERARQLEEIGFYPGERVTVMARGFPGGEPLVVRIGQSTFALRGDEAACVQIDGGSGNPDA